MEPFRFCCPTCAAKLKVQNPKLIGQKLACPKCQAMVLVETPEGYELPESASVETEWSGAFEDIDSILASTPQEAPSQSPRQSGHPKSHRPPDNAPLVPNENWVSPSAQSRRKWVLVISAATGVVLLVGAIIAAIIANRAAPEPAIASNDQTATDAPASPPENNETNGALSGGRCDFGCPDCRANGRGMLP